MQKSTNLYAPPETPTGKPPTEGIWRYGNLLAVAHSAELPTQWCFKTNEPTTHVGSLFLGAKLFSDRKWFLSFGLNEQLAKRRVWRQRIAIASFLAFTAVLTPVATFAMLHSQFLIPQYLGSGEVFDNALLVFMSLLAIAAFFFSIWTICMAANTIQIMEVWRSKHFNFLRGAHPEFLARFPEWERS